MKDIFEVQRILREVRFQNYEFVLQRAGTGWFLQVQFLALDNEDPSKVIMNHGRKWYISSFATESEIVQTALKAVLTSVEHEAREQFTYKGKALFGPHLDVARLLELADETVHRAPVMEAA